MPREPYPLLLSLAAALTTGLGLIAAALGIKWGSPPPPGDALPNAWIYVNVLLTLTTLILWPAAQLRPRSLRHHFPLLWQAAAMSVAVLPALSISAFVSNATFPMIGRMLILQGSFGLLALAILHLHTRLPAVADVLIGILAALTLLGPVAAFLWSQFFPLASQSWFSLLPLASVARAANPTASTGSATANPWITAPLYAASAVLILLLAAASGAQKKAPGTEVPRA
jgi:hypothetical protein